MTLRTLLLYSLLGLVACTTSKEITTRAPLSQLELRETGPASFEDWMHSPLRAQNNEAVTFNTVASLANGISKVELYVYEYELYLNKDGLQSQKERPNGIWGKVRTWEFEAFESQVRIEHTHQLGFKAHTRVEYIWRVIGRDASVSDRFARFDAGTSPWPKDKILLYSASRRNMTEAIDIGFFRDTDYKNDKARFYSDVEEMIIQGFLKEGTFGNDRRYWAFYATDREADGKAISNDITNESLLPNWIKDYSIPGIDAFCLVHLEDYTDRSLLLENFHSLSNNLFSAEAHNWGTAVHECGHAIFHLSDEYGGCACFQSQASSNVFKEKESCVAWNVANGFNASDCYELSDVYDRTWYSAEQPTFFTTEEACRAHNLAAGISADSCRNFINRSGEELYWAFEATCIMLDDGDHIVRPFQRACRRVISNFYEKLNRRKDFDLAFASPAKTNIFGYEPVVLMEMTKQEELWSLKVAESTTMGVPTNGLSPSGEVVMRVMDDDGNEVSSYQLAQPGAVHVHAHEEDSFSVPNNGTLLVAVPVSKKIAHVVCEFDRDMHEKSADISSVAYREGFVFDVKEDVAKAMEDHK